MSLEAKSILITQLRLNEYAGSELVTLELVEYFSEHFQRVIVATTSYQDPVKSEFEKVPNLSIYNINDAKLNDFLKSEPVDFAWIHHGMIPDALIDNPGNTKFIFHHMSPYAEFEFPLFANIEKALGHKILCNSKETLDEFISQKVFDKTLPVEVFNNPAPESFAKDITKPKKHLTKILVVSNHVPVELRQALSLLKADGIQITYVGSHEDTYRRVTPEDIKTHDVIVSIGKTVQYSILSQKPVYCYDRFGGPGYFNSNNFEKAKDLNFSGRGFDTKRPHEIADEIKTEYSIACEYAENLYELRDDFTLERRIEDVMRDISNEKVDLLPLQASEKVVYKKLRELIFKKIPSLQRADQQIEEKDGLIERLKVSAQTEKNNAQYFYDQLEAVRRSYPYKIGRVATIPVRLARGILRIARAEYGRIQIESTLRRTIEKHYQLSAGTGAKERIGVIIRSYHHPTSSTFIRMLSPLSSDLVRKQISTYLVNGDRPKIARNTSAIIVQRTALCDLKTAKALIEMTKKRGIRVFVDTDDAFGELDVSHPQYTLQKERVEALDYVMQHADEVWFSTEALRDLYGLEKNKIVKNTLDTRLWSRLRKKRIDVPGADVPLRMVYMGTITHDADFALIIPALKRLHEVHEGAFELHVIGVARQLDQYPWMIQHKPDSALYPDFVDWFSNLPQFDIGLSPLEDSNFNRNKSDIKCLDYLACGIHPVVSDVEAYRNNELNNLITRVNNTEEDWYTVLEKMVKTKEKRRKNMNKSAAAGFDYILSRRSTNVAATEIATSLGIRSQGRQKS